MEIMSTLNVYLDYNTNCLFQKRTIYIENAGYQYLVEIFLRIDHIYVERILIKWAIMGSTLLLPICVFIA